ncbi:TatD-related deoxyribonuclease [Alicycliphilus sp. B1]|nr:TatD-related deoxyribonuclease [Alicycliphilus sp. B1]
MIRRMDAWIDTHCHLDEFAVHGGAAHADAERARAARAGVVHCVLPAVDLANLQVVRAMAHRYGDSYALGIHPLYTPQALRRRPAGAGAHAGAMPSPTRAWWPSAR